jgi:hypothetical protein
MDTLKVGDAVTRLFGGTSPAASMELRVTKITEDRIICGGWEFDRATGAEIDDDLGWGPPPRETGSFLCKLSSGEYSHAALPEDEIERYL